MITPEAQSDQNNNHDVQVNKFIFIKSNTLDNDALTNNEIKFLIKIIDKINFKLQNKERNIQRDE